MYSRKYFISSPKSIGSFRLCEARECQVALPLVLDDSLHSNTCYTAYHLNNNEYSCEWDYN